ncbi:MAG TPA: glutamate racemase [Thermoanaerobaculia bacterium]|nr:glutamate racemase [Thermoanaerobaculia bacterium]
MSGRGEERRRGRGYSTLTAGDRDRPIGIFDSGVGGLTVFREIARLLPRESLIYLGDSARVPYGTKSPETVARYSLEAARHLLARGIKMLVVACNTATAAALETLKRELPIVVIGVIEPGARAAATITRGTVGVIATEGTVRSGAYARQIRMHRPSVRVVESACPLFVPLAEEGWANTRVCREVAEIYLRPLLDEGIDTLVLGCTHYPILRPTIQHVIGEGIGIIDSAQTTAEVVRDELGRLDLLRQEGEAEPHFLVTDAAERFRRIAGEFLDSEVERLELVGLGEEPSLEHARVG